MLKDIDFGKLEVISATKNINDLGNTKDVLVSITMVKEEHSFAHLTGIEKMTQEVILFDTGKHIKLSCSYTKNDKNQISLPIKVAFRNGDERYSNKVFYERELNPDIFEDLNFIEQFFDRTDDRLKRVFL
jgi:hypothetical protein